MQFISSFLDVMLNHHLNYMMDKKEMDPLCIIKVKFWTYEQNRYVVSLFLLQVNFYFRAYRRK